jgi:membrane-bound serine protease (ClpP class)
LAPVVRDPGEAIPDRDTLAELLGQVGRVVTPLRPVGMCDFEGKRLECVSESGYVSKGQMVKVIRVEGTQLTVRVVDNA